MITLINGDCLELMKNLPDKSIDLFICDLPYVDMKGNGETNCKWNQSAIDLEEFWIQFKRLRKSKRTACIHFCSTKFGYTIIKSNEKMFKMDMVWKKRNKTGGLQSRNRPMRNHEMVYFFYEQAPQYNRDKYHKRIVAKNPTDKKNKTIKAKDRKSMGEQSGIYAKENQISSNFEPPNPASVIEEKVGGDIYGEDKKDQLNRRKKMYKKTGNVNSFEPPNPPSVLEEEEKCLYGFNKKDKQNYAVKDLGKNHHFDPPNPASVVEEEFIEPVEDEPKSMFESKKVFIGKRNHQTEKPQDILEFFIKYWSDEGHTILDPTMGSGSTGVACKKLKRNFIGFEKDDKIFNVAKNRIDKINSITI
jgi:DNA modification methylase